MRDFAALPATDREVIAVRRARMIFLERRTLPRFDAAVRVVRLDLEHPERWPERLVDGGA